MDVWLKVSERIEYKIISLTCKILNTTQPSYLYDLASIHPPHGHNTRSSPYVTLIKPSSSRKVTHRSYMLHLIFGTSFLHHSEFLIRIIHPPLSDLHLNMPVSLATLCSHLPSLFHCFTLSSKLTFAENVILHLSLFLSVGLISWL